MPFTRFILYVILFSLLNFKVCAEIVEDCKWDNRSGTPCITVTKTPNTSGVSERSINKIIINRKDIEASGALDVVEVLKYFESIDIKQMVKEVS